MPRRLVVAVIAAGLAIAAGVTIVLIEQSNDPEATPAVASGGTYTRGATGAPTATVSATSVVTPTRPLEVKIPELGVDAKIEPIAFKDGSINPPGVADAYWIEAYGAPGLRADNTVYLLGHSWDEGDAVFNPLFDRGSQTSNIEPTDSIVVTTANGDVHYVVDRYARYPRTDLADVDDVWEVVPGRLILVTCFQPADGSAPTDNFVVYAHAVP